MTDDSGRYSLRLPSRVRAGDTISVLARHLGYAPVTSTVRVAADTLRLDFTLTATPARLSEIVETGPGRSDAPARDYAVADHAMSKSAAAPGIAGATAAARGKPARGTGRAGGRGDDRTQGPNAGVLTAAVWDDVAHWARYSRFLDRADSASWNAWDLDPSCLVTLRGALAPNTPLVLTQGRRTAVVRARADGTARFFPCVEGFRRAAFDVAVDSGVPERVVPERGDAVRLAARSLAAPERHALDLGFLVDATGSMGDEMHFLQTELQDIVRRVRAVEPELDVRISVVFYRDRGDEFVTRTLPFTRDVDSAVAFLTSASANGGGDYPEDMNAGFAEMMRQDWSRDAAPRLLFLLADAPPQRYADERYTYREGLRDAAAGGIAVYPVAASGTDKSTEYLFRAAAVLTGGKYIFLTDDSGVGDHHEEPDISGYKVEKLNDLMVREIRSYVRAYLRGERVADGR